MRSWLIAPATDAGLLAGRHASGADALVIDLTAASPAGKDAARAAAVALLADCQPAPARSARLYVMIHPLDSAFAAADVEAVMPAGPDGIVLPGARDGADVQQLDVMLSVAEALADLPAGRTGIVAICGDTAAGALSAASFAGKSPRLEALAWRATDLARDLGATRVPGADNGLADGGLGDGPRLARALTLLAATAAGVDVIDAPSDLADPESFSRDCRAARADGFTGRFAGDARHIPIINAAFAPTPAERAAAQAIVDGFAADGGAPDRIGADGRRLSRRDHARALRVLARAALAGS